MAAGRRFELSEGTANKFWEITLEGSAFTVRFGRIGTAGQTQTKTFASDGKAQAEHDKLLREKTNKGYREVGSASTGAEPAPVSRSADGPRVRWTAAARRRLEPLRPCPAPAPPTPTDWPAIQQAWARWDAAVEQGLQHADPRQRALAEAARQSASQRVPAAAEVEGARAALLGANGWFSTFLPQGPRFGYIDPEGEEPSALLASHWCAEAGLAAAVEAAARSLEHDAIMGHITGSDGVWLEMPAAGNMLVLWTVPALWRRIREHVCAAEEPAYEEARQKARALRDGASARVRCALAYVFPHEAEWAATDAREMGAGTLQADARVWWLLASLDDLAAARTAVRCLPQDGVFQDTIFYNLLETIGAEAFDLLVALLPRVGPGGVRSALLQAMALVESPEAFFWFADHLDDREIAGAAVKAFSAAPVAAIAALARFAGDRAESRGRLMLRTLLVSHPEAAEAAQAGLEAPQRAVLAEARTGSGADADPGELPPVLTSPPWQERRAAKPRAVIPGLAPPASEERVARPTGGALGEAARRFWYGSADERSAREDERWLAEIEQYKKGGTWGGAWVLHRLTDGAALKAWNEGPASLWRYSSPGELFELVERLGIAALPGLLAFADKNLVTAAEVLARIRSPRVALPLALALRLRKARPFAIRWLTAEPEESAAWLIPAAVGEEGPDRKAAESALRYLAANGHDAAVRAAARARGSAVEAAVEEVLGWDPLLLFPARMPKMPAFWNAAALSRPLLRGRTKALPVDAVDVLGTMLAISSLEEPYAGLEQVREACDPRSLGEFAWDVFSAWQMAGGPAKEAWAFFALGHLGDDDVARRLSPILREWPQAGQSARAAQGLDVLAMIGTDVALMHLHGLSQRVKSRPLQEKAAAKIEEIAEARGLSSEELADRLVPDLGLDSSGSRVLDFGPRSFRVGFDEQLRPFVLDAAGKRVSELPKPGKADDAAKAGEATATWKALKKDVRGIATLQLRRLEQAMCTRRRWSLESFRAFFVDHPLLTHLAKRLVWGLFDESGRVLSTFRVAEDKSIADVRDGSLELPGGLLVGLPHRLELSGEDLEAWGRVLGDYQILQPFPQVGRLVHRRTPGEETGHELRQLKGRKVETVRVLGLESRGWQRGAVGDGGVIGVMIKPLPGSDYQAELALDPGIVTGSLGTFPEQTLGAAVLQRKDTWDEASRLPVGELDDIVYSELVGDLLTLDR